ncbi:ubiquinone biosynthesis protein UbiE [Parafrankia colletiae]|uniref:Ubiquinone biosynthesis protein UbiE n=1 Tax=Parafrankia colletiae TaxID=573497 RepID=A0A1S1QZ58_9ACTN|nr:class I SAM-dependent methyltransferase [Parafrankia colletiae]MCK9899503.1 methyltransferase domain-containing protein [Frankia sp. Cpl3]OHV38761.1 ubiquinone biosynthesis protein UbiE [Parafrankia colletiae]
MSPGSLFDPLADAYDQARPSYPDQLFVDLEMLAGRPVAGAGVVDVGAGTGIATRAMLARGARVLPVDLGPVMLDRLRRHSPDLPVVRGDGEALPLRDACADLVTYAQAWHWVGVPAAAAEAARVLRPGGSLAVWWNDVDAEDFHWYQRQQDRLEAMSPGYTRDYRSRPFAEELRWTGLFAEVVTVTCRWHREIDLDRYETWLRSKSFVAAIGDRVEDFLAAERRSLLRSFPDGLIIEPFRTVLVVARLP